MNKVLQSYLQASLPIGFVIILAHLTALKINELQILNANQIGWLQTLSAIPGATVIFGKPEWDIQTWGGISYPEVLNRRISNLLNLIGLFLLALAFQLK